MKVKHIYSLSLLLAVILLQFIFPPWQNIFDNGKVRIVKYFGYAFIFGQPSTSPINTETSINWGMLSATLAITILVAALIFLITKPLENGSAWQLLVKYLNNTGKEAFRDFQLWVSSKEFRIAAILIVIIGPLIFAVPIAIKLLTPYELLDEVEGLFMITGTFCLPAGLLYYRISMRKTIENKRSDVTRI